MSLGVSVYPTEMDLLMELETYDLRAWYCSNRVSLQTRSLVTLSVDKQGGTLPWVSGSKRYTNKEFYLQTAGLMVFEVVQIRTEQ